MLALLLALPEPHYRGRCDIEASGNQQQVATRLKRRLSGLRGKRVAIGKDGSGTQAIARQLLTANAITEANAELVVQGGQDAAQALQARRLDAMFMVTAARAAMVRQLIKTDGIEVSLPSHVGRIWVSSTALRTR